ncbi:MAG: PTS sugar transporter subunit IIC [Candidatus Eisenbacteria bacterium]
MSVPLLLTWLLGGVAALDATPVAQTLLSQPLVTAALLGWIWGDLKLALEVGIVLQILAAGTLPVGARTPEDYAAGGVVGTGLALALSAQLPFEQVRDACALVGVFAGLATAILSVPVLKWQRRRNESLARWTEGELRAGRITALTQAQGAGWCSLWASVLDSPPSPPERGCGGFMARSEIFRYGFRVPGNSPSRCGWALAWRICSTHFFSAA